MANRDDTAPATKADVAAIHKAIAVLDKRFTVLEEQIDRRFDDVDRRFDTVDKQFDKVLEYVHGQGKESRLHVENLADEIRRHFDATTKSLKDYFVGIFQNRSNLYGEKFRQLDGRIRVLERRNGLTSSSLV